MKKNTPNHPKLSHLMELLGIHRYEAVGILESLWHFAAEWTADGLLSKYSPEAVCSAIDHHDPERLIPALIESRWLDRLEDGRLYIHDWHEHCENSVHRKLALAVGYFANGHKPSLTKVDKRDRPDLEDAYDRLEAGEPVQPKLPGVPTQPPAEKKPRARRRPTNDPRFDDWWNLYPRKKNRKTAERMWLRINPAPALFDVIMAALTAQMEPGQALGPDVHDTYMPLPSTWLNNERWKDALDKRESPGAPPPAGTPLPEFRNPTDADLR